MFESFRDRDLKDTGSCDEPGADAPLVPCKGGTTRESLIEGAKTKHTHREGLYALRIRCRGVGQNFSYQKPVCGKSKFCKIQGMSKGSKVHAACYVARLYEISYVQGVKRNKK